MRRGHHGQPELQFMREEAVEPIARESAILFNALQSQNVALSTQTIHRIHCTMPPYMPPYVQFMRKAASAVLPSTKAILFNILQSPQMALPS